MKDSFPLLILFLIGTATAFAQTSYKQVASASKLETGKDNLIVAENAGAFYVMGKQNKTATSENRCPDIVNYNSNSTTAVHDATGRKVMETSVTKGENTINEQNFETDVRFFMTDNTASKFLKH